MSVLPTRHAQWYFKDGSFIIRAEDKLYNIYGEILSKHSVFFSTMLTLPQPGVMAVGGGEAEVGNFRSVRERARANGEDGSSDAKAFEIPHTSHEFDCLLECMFWEFTTAERSVEYLAIILKLSDFYEAPKLSYGVSQWIEPAFRQLVDIPFLTLSDGEISQLGFNVFVLLARTHARIVHHRQMCAVRPPPVVHDAGCVDPEDCSKAWNHAWWGEAEKSGVALALVHPERRISGRDILAKLGGIQPGWGMDVQCLELTLSKVEGSSPEGKSRLTMEEEFIQEAIDTLIAAQRNQTCLMV